MTLSLGKQLQAVISKMENDMLVVWSNIYDIAHSSLKEQTKNKKKILKVFYDWEWFKTKRVC